MLIKMMFYFFQQSSGSSLGGESVSSDRKENNSNVNIQSLLKEVKMLCAQVRSWRKETQELLAANETITNSNEEEVEEIFIKIKKVDNDESFLNNEKRFTSELPEDVKFRSKMVNIFYF